MYMSDDIKYIGVNDRKIDLFEGQYIVPNGMSYNSYVIIDEKIAVMDTVDAAFTHEWLDNLQNAIGSRKPDYLIIQHTELAAEDRDISLKAKVSGLVYTLFDICSCSISCIIIIVVFEICSGK